jgi:hypothetical protein
MAGGRGFPGGGDGPIEASSTDDGVTILRAIAQNLSALVIATEANVPIPFSGAPVNAQYLVGAADGVLTADRLVTDTATVSWDLATATAAKANVVDGSITNAKLADMANATFKGRTTAGTGDPEDLTAAQAVALLPDATATQRGVVELATDAEIRSAAASPANTAISAAAVETAAAGVALTDAATVAVDWDAAINFTLTVTANRIIGNPTNGQVGTWRTILVQGNDATDRTITFGANYLGEVPTITDCDSGRWYLLAIYCVSTSHFVVSSKRAKG